MKYCVDKQFPTQQLFTSKDGLFEITGKISISKVI